MANHGDTQVDKFAATVIRIPQVPDFELSSRSQLCSNCHITPYCFAVATWTIPQKLAKSGKAE
ncbi:MAG: hypothetical protein CBE00_03425 [Planctomycetaceae bacterium TMED240]|nr:MAG: hypothetical protein CBE00_03425 [Planctomycetaceae bacterium TMED240]